MRLILTLVCIEFLFCMPVRASDHACKYGEANKCERDRHGVDHCGIVRGCAGNITVTTPDDLAVQAAADQQNLQQHTAQEAQQRQQEVQEKIAAAEDRIKKSLTASIDQLPQRLLSDAAKQEIKAEIMAEMKAQIDQLRTDLQGQIDHINAQLSGNNH